MFKYVLFWSLI